MTAHCLRPDIAVNVLSVSKPFERFNPAANVLPISEMRDSLEEWALSAQRSLRATLSQTWEQKNASGAMLLFSMSSVLSAEQVAVDLRSAALAEVEASETFARNEQLRSFLRFVCEYEVTGRGDLLHEYLIGVEVFRQKTGYSTTENAIVRNRAHSLRRKLAEYYASEGSDARLRIEIPKGSYCPRFVEMPGICAAPPGQPAPLSPDRLTSSKRAKNKSLVFIASLCAALSAITLALGYEWGRSKTTALDPVLAEAWGPLLSHSSHTVISIANAPELLVRSLPDDRANFKRLPDSLDLKDWYLERYKMGSTDHLYITPNHNSPLWGDAASAVTVARLLSRSNVDMEVLPERVQAPFAFRDRNAVLIGRPENSPASALFLRELFFNIGYSPEVHDQEVSYKDASGKTTYLTRIPGRVHGLISVLHTRSTDGNVTQLVIFSGVNSAGTMAAAEFFCSAARMREFRQALQQHGVSKFPDRYQIVISTEESNILPFNYFMETYKTS